MAKDFSNFASVANFDKSGHTDGDGVAATIPNFIFIIRFKFAYSTKHVYKSILAKYLSCLLERHVWAKGYREQILHTFAHIEIFLLNHLRIGEPFH